jgi:hypothetical protein
MRAPGDTDIANRFPSQPVKERDLALLDVSIEAQGADVESLSARSSYERRADPAAEGSGGHVHHQATALPPADRVAAGCCGVESDATHDVTVGAERDEDPRRWITVEVVAVVGREESLQIHEFATAQPAIGGEAARILAGVNDQPRLGRGLPGGGTAE